MSDKRQKCKVTGCSQLCVATPDKTKPTIWTVGDSKKNECPGVPIYPPKRTDLCYYHTKKERKLLSGILFTLATFKLIVIFFPFILLITRRIKIKEALYYILPFFVLMIPYIVNPPYFWQMVGNWTFSETGESNMVLGFLYAILKVFEPAQLMFVSFGVFILLVNIKDESWKNRALIVALLVLITMFVFYLVLMGTFTRAPT